MLCKFSGIKSYVAMLKNIFSIYREKHTLAVYADKGCIHWCGSYVHFAATLFHLNSNSVVLYTHMEKRPSTYCVSPTVLLVNSRKKKLLFFFC